MSSLSPGTLPDADDRLRALADLANELKLDRLATDALTWATRIAEGRFFVACVGQFKRGKSTLLNALIGDAVLPTGVVPVTSVVTVIRHGPVRRARIRQFRRSGKMSPSTVLPIT